MIISEVKYIKRIITFLIPVFILMLLPVTVRAAGAGDRAGQVSISGGWLNVRSAPNSGSAKVSTLQKGSFVTLVSQSGLWWKVEYANGRYGYCHADYIREVSSQARTVAVSSGYLNVRSGPATAYSRVGSAYKGETVLVLSSAKGWSRILFQGNRIGYVSDQYLSGQQQYGARSVSAPNLKQMDSRWADKEVGTSGKTFAQIGCATTGIAIIESHRRGYTVTPDAISQELRYTPGGSVYWPTDYIPITSSQGYLQTIYDRLSAGHPVLLGMRNSSGQQHWVVVNGFTGGPALTADRFAIRDPGSNVRTNLQQLLDKYPVFYKLFVY